MKFLLFITIFATISMADIYYYQFGEKVSLTALKETRTVNGKTFKYYKTQNTQKVSFTNDILIKCVNDTLCRKTLVAYNVHNIKKLTKTLYSVEVNKGSDIFIVAQRLYNDANVKFATPNMIKQRKKR